jgi:hypothetical protein
MARLQINTDHGTSLAFVAMMLAVIAGAGLATASRTRDAAHFQVDKISRTVEYQRSGLSWAQFYGDDQWCSSLNALKGVSGMVHTMPNSTPILINEGSDFYYQVGNVKSDSMAGGGENPWVKMWSRSMYQVGNSIDPVSRPRYRIPCRLGYRWRYRTYDEAVDILAWYKAAGNPLMRWVWEPPVPDPLPPKNPDGTQDGVPGYWYPVERTIDTWGAPFDDGDTKRESVSGHGFLVETDADLSVLACYNKTASRSMCLDAGGVYDPGGSPKCTLAASTSTVISTTTTTSTQSGP